MKKQDISLSYKTGKTISDADAIMEQIEIALLTIPDEFSPDTNFGLGLEQYIYEINDEVNAKAIRHTLLAYMERRFPEVSVADLVISRPQLEQINIKLDINILDTNERRTVLVDYTGV